MADVAIGGATLAPVRAKASHDDILMRLGLCVLLAWLIVVLALPLWTLLSKSMEDSEGRFVGLANFATYFSTPSLFASVWNSFFVALAVTLIVMPMAFVYAYALTRSRMRLKWLFQGMALLPIFAPSLLPAISFIYLFGNQGLLKSLLAGGSIYGPAGIIAAQVFYCFPSAVMILATALALADARLYEAADALGATRRRIFFTITLPGAKYGAIGASFVVFTQVITDFGIAKVIGGKFNVLATDVYKQVIGQQNFSMGAVVGIVLLAPAVLAFVVDRLVQRRQVALLSARAVPLEPKDQRLRDALLTVFCTIVALLIATIIGVSVWGSLIKYWPYNPSWTLDNYAFGNFDSEGWNSFFNSIQMAFCAAIVGTVIVFLGAWLVEKTRGATALRGVVQFLALLPMAVPGLVLGLGYIFFFNARANPLNFLYATMAILVINTTAHFYTVAHVTAVTALKQIDPEFEAVSASLKVPYWRTLLRVTIPICVPAIIDIAVFIFVNAMTTVSSVIFLYSSDTKLGSIAVVNMDEAGATAAAAAMSVMIVLTSATVKALHLVAERGLLGRLQAWRRR